MYESSQSGVPGFMQDVGQFLTGSNNDFTNAAVLPSLATAAQQWQQAGQYQDLGNQAADRADPFGQYRRGYGDQLQGLYQDPSKIANTPGYKFTMDQTLNNTASKLASMGLLGSSQMQNTLADRAAGLASTTWNTEADRLARLAGAQFDPANAARMQMEGGKLKMDAQSNALGALMYPFGPGAAGGRTAGGQQGGSSGSAASQVAQIAQKFGPQAGQTAMQLFNKFLTSPGDMTPADIHLMEQLGIDTGVDTGGMDYAPPNYDWSGFGGYGGAVNDPTLQGIGFGDPNFSVGNYDDVMGGGYNFYPSIEDTAVDPWDVMGDGSAYGLDNFDMTGFQIDPWG